ncbi:MAG: FkbM family methyltransferase [Rhodospirillaceae bacterium]|nr:FkbM family methyltransferase [Rhodospirillaceae bacterium]
MQAYWTQLSWRGRATYAAHLFKACAQQHHRETGPLVRALVPADGVILDVGAHGGQFAKLFARLVPRGWVHAFEPSGYARSILRQALRVNRLGNVSIHAYGLSDHDAEMELNTPVKRSGSAGFGTASLGAPGAGAAVIRERVRVRRMDDALADLALPRLDLVKADIEGWEMRMLAGGSRSLERFRPALLLELSPAALARAGDDLDSVSTFLGRLGYVPFLPDDGGRTWRQRAPSDPADVLWLAGRHLENLDSTVFAG